MIQDTFGISLCCSGSAVCLLIMYNKLRDVYKRQVGVQCGGMCDMEAIKEQGLAGVTAVTEDGEALCVSTIYGEETIKKADALLLKCKTCKSKKIVCYDELDVYKRQFLSPGRLAGRQFFCGFP